MAGKLGSLQDNQKQSYKEVTDNAVTEVAQRVTDPLLQDSLTSIDENTTRQGTLTNYSGTATTTSAAVIASNTARKYLFLQNVSGGTIWMNFGTAAVASQPSIEISPGDVFVMDGAFISTQSVNIRSQTGSRDFVLKEG